MSEQLVHINCGGAIAIVGRTVEDGSYHMVHWCRACGAHSDVFTDTTVIGLDLAHSGPLLRDEIGDFIDAGRIALLEGFPPAERVS